MARLVKTNVPAPIAKAADRAPIKRGLPIGGDGHTNITTGAHLPSTPSFKKTGGPRSG